MAWRFKDYNSTARATLCHLYEYDARWGTWGAWLGSVFAQDYGGWVWHAEECDWDLPEDDPAAGHGVQETRRLAKRELRKWLKQR